MPQPSTGALPSVAPAEPAEPPSLRAPAGPHETANPAKVETEKEVRAVGKEEEGGKEGEDGEVERIVRVERTLRGERALRVERAGSGEYTARREPTSRLTGQTSRIQTRRDAMLSDRGHLGPGSSLRRGHERPEERRLRIERALRDQRPDRPPAAERIRLVLRIGALAMTVLVLLLGSWSGSADAATPSRGIARVCPAPPGAGSGTPATPFPDAGATHGPAIACAADYGLVTGFRDGTYGTTEALTRGQMATVVRRFIETATGERLPAPTANAFSDIAGSVHRDAIAALHAAGVVSGRSDGRFEPGATVTRGQMARFLVGALDRVVNPDTAGDFPPATSTAAPFTDTLGTTFEADIRSLAAHGVVQGTTPTTYQPALPVTRGQLATFLLRAADLLAAEEAWLPVRVPVAMVLDVLLTGEAVVAPDANGNLVTGQGQLGATATATLTLDAETGVLTYDIVFPGVQGPFDAAAGVRLQLGRAGTIGDPVLRIASGTQLQGAAGQRLTGLLQDTDTAGNDVAAAIREIMADPTGYYLTLRSNAYPMGAVRGQLTVRR